MPSSDTRTAAPDAPCAGRTLDHYELEDPIGEGAMGEVHGARDRALVTAMAVSHAVTFVLCLAGMGIAALHPQKRALHDLVCGTRVVYELAPPRRG